MNILSVFATAKRGLRRNLPEYLVTIAGLVIAFLCLAVALWFADNLDKLAEVWRDNRRVSVYLREDIKPEQVAALRLTLTALPDIRSLEYITPAKAKSAFAGPTALGTDALSLPDEFFPASFELAIHRNVGEARLEKLAVTVHKLDGIEQVEIYRDWFKQLSSLITASRWAAGLLSVLVALCVLAVISHTVRLTAHERRAQIEVLKLCGATDRFITAPFVVEGAAQGLLSAFFAILLFFIGYALFQPSLASAMTVLIGINPTFLTPLTSLAVVVGGGLVGGLSGLISLRRYLDI